MIGESGLVGVPVAVRARMERHLDSYLEQGGSGRMRSFPAAGDPVASVLLELRRRRPTMREGGISSFRAKGHGHEADFIVGDILDEEPPALVQVTDAMADEKTATRELRALWEALEESWLEEAALVVGRGDFAEYARGGRRIVQVPAWRWLLFG